MTHEDLQHYSPSANTPNQESAASAPHLAASSPESRKANKLPLVLGILVVLGLVAAAAGWYYTTTPGYVATKFLKSHIATLRQQNFADAYAQTTAGFKSQATQAEYQDFAENLGLVSADIPYKITQKSVYVRETDLTDQGAFLVRLTGKTGETQDMRFSLTTEYGNWRVRLVEVTGDSDGTCAENTCPQIGMDYDAPAKETADVQPVQPTQDPVVTQPVASTVPVAEPSQAATAELTWERLSEVSSPPSRSAYSIMPVTDARFQNAARVAVEQHIGNMRFGKYTEAIEQLSPEFKRKVTPTDYAQFLTLLGVPDIIRFSWEVVGTDVRIVNGVYAAKVRVVFKDFKNTGSGAAPQQLFINVGAYNISKDELGILDYKKWKIISFFSDQHQAQFFPY